MASVFERSEEELSNNSKYFEWKHKLANLLEFANVYLQTYVAQGDRI